MVTKVRAFAVAVACALTASLLVADLAYAKPRKKAAPPQANCKTWMRASGNMWTGVRVYAAANTNTYVGTIIGGSEHHYDREQNLTFRGVVIQYPNSVRQWKLRNE